MPEYIVTDPQTHRERMQALELAIRECLEPMELQVNHYFAHGTYTRELIIPKGTMATGKIHLHSCTNIVTKGRIKAITDEGEYEIEAPHVFVSGAGVKKAVYALEDTVWINVHPWDGVQNLEQIEKSVIAPSYEELALASEERSLCLGH